MSSQQTFYEYLMDKLDELNINVKVTQSELKDTLIEISNKAVKYELITSIIWLVILIAVIVISYKALTKMTKTKGMKKVLKCIGSTDILNDVIKLALCTIALATIVFAIIGIIVQAVDIIECIVFPEKVILEFIGRYL